MTENAESAHSIDIDFDAPNTEPEEKTETGVTAPKVEVIAEDGEQALPVESATTAAVEDAGETDTDWREQAQDELRRLGEQNEQQDEPDQSLRTVTSDQVVQTLNDNLDRLSPELRSAIVSGLQDLLESEWLDAETWQGIAYVLQVVLETQVDVLKRRLRGQYEVDAWGYDPEFAEYMLLIGGFFFNRYWRIQFSGVENIPNSGRTLLVSNHSGVLPFDAAMISYGVREHHAAHRLTRAMVADWFPSLPFVSTVLNKTGLVLAHPENGERLLAEDELVLVFPEGYKGVGKLFKDRYKLARFGRGGFVRMAMAAQTPIIPVSVVGAEETYPMLYNVKPIARMIGFPLFPITPTWPWFGLLGFVPVPSKWYIDVGEPIDTSQYDPELANNPAFISELTDLVRNKVQEQINTRLEQRRSVFFG